MEPAGAVFSTTLYPPPPFSPQSLSPLALPPPPPSPFAVSQRPSVRSAPAAAAEAALPAGALSSSLPFTRASPSLSLASQSQSLSYSSLDARPAASGAAAPQRLIAPARSAELRALFLARSDLRQPSFFELVAQQKLLEGLLAALQHVVDVLTNPLEREEEERLRRADADAVADMQRRSSHAWKDGREAAHAVGGAREEGKKDDPTRRKEERQKRGANGGPRRASVSDSGTEETQRPGRFARLSKGVLGDLLLFLRERRSFVSPRRLVLWMLTHWELLYGLCIAGVEYQSLCASSASFAEHFYGLQRLDSAWLPVSSSIEPSAAPPPASSQPPSASGFLPEASEAGPEVPSAASAGAAQVVGSSHSRLPTEEAMNRKREQDAEISRMLNLIEAAGRTPAGGLTLRKRQVFFSVLFLLLPLLRRKLHAAYLRSVRTLNTHSTTFLNESPFTVETASQGEGEEEERYKEAETRKQRAFSAFRRTLSRVVRLVRAKVRSFSLLLRHVWRVRWALFAKFYPAASGLHGLVCFVYMLLYLADSAKFPYWSPSMHALGLVYVRGPPPFSPFSPFFPLSGVSAVKRGSGTSPESPARARLLRVGVDFLARTLARFSRLALVSLALSLRLLDWWRDYETAVRAAATQNDLLQFPGLGAEALAEKAEAKEIKIPPPPAPPQGVGASCVPLPQDDRICPLCHRPRTNAACLSTGFVFCYRCVVNFVRAHQRCPVSGRSVREDHIRRLYEV
ncbi:hypothetical protein BESB_005540 [Besnoitia besnoiti]|uniref:Peroxin-12 n=1 Tax=Besnoitia besnoiti TaxID=94643 RepID=A0A2A9MQ01_BESBE|nr:hypothetical protein BESB_005540 [Besnoitia besnoiti]PFH38213.1 hypothetical protein BESB_005540 [Besnoitia besnoiti]